MNRFSQLPQDKLKELMSLNVQQVRSLGADQRMAWFESKHVQHPELCRVLDQVLELLNPYNDTKVICMVGMTGIGKTTLATATKTLIESRRDESNHKNTNPTLYVTVPANGEKSISWKIFYHRILEAADERCIDKKRLIREDTDFVVAPKSIGRSTAVVREFVEAMFRSRQVKVLIIDECMHLLRFGDLATTMDTLKSLADATPDTKLILIGTHQISNLLCQYGQVIRRSEIVHYRRYRLESKSGSKPRTPDERNFVDCLQKLESLWPCQQVPELVRNWHPLMDHTLGSVGLVKEAMNRLLAQQLQSKGEQLKEEHWSKAFKGAKLMDQIRNETEEGERSLSGRCYGDGDPDLDFFSKIGNKHEGAYA